MPKRSPIVMERIARRIHEDILLVSGLEQRHFAVAYEKGPDGFDGFNVVYMPPERDSPEPIRVWLPETPDNAELEAFVIQRRSQILRRVAENVAPYDSTAATRLLAEAERIVRVALGITRPSTAKPAAAASSPVNGPSHPLTAPAAAIPPLGDPVAIESASATMGRSLSELVLEHLGKNARTAEFTAVSIASAVNGKFPGKDRKRLEQEVETVLRRLVSEGRFKAARKGVTSGGYTIWSCR